MPLRSYIVALLVAATGFAFSGCAQRGSTLPPVSFDAVSPFKSPPDCKGQKTTKKYATLTAPLQASGGAFCIPAIGGFGGKLEYPNASFKGSVTLTLTSSVKNYNNEPQLGSGKALFYIQFAISGPVKFGSNIKSGGGLTAKKIIAGNPYSIYGQAVIFGQKFGLGPCVTTATQGKYGGVLGELGSLIKNQTIPFAASGVLEVYSGEDTTAQCSGL